LTLTTKATVSDLFLFVTGAVVLLVEKA